MKKTTEATPDACGGGDHPVGVGDVSASGLSSSRCRPAVAARTAMSACTSGGSATATASQASMQRVDVGEGRHPVPLGQRRGPVRVTPPDPGQLGVRVCVHRRPCVSVAQ